MRRALVLMATCLAIAVVGPGCGGGGDGDADVDNDADQGGLTFGQECVEGSECASGVCWSASDSDPLCFGSGCSMTCETAAECIEAARAVGASSPDAATCSEAGVCDLWDAGVVSVACA